MWLLERGSSDFAELFIGNASFALAAEKKKKKKVTAVATRSRSALFLARLKNFCIFREKISPVLVVFSTKR